MNRFAKDPGLNELAARLKDVVWAEPLDPTEVEELSFNATSPASVAGSCRRRVVPLPGYRNWAVRLYLGGATRTIGYATNDTLPNALRFADMAAAYFWKYRVRGACPPEEETLNRSKADVERDMQTETHALGLLRDIERYLLDAEILQTAEQRHALVKAKKAQSLRMLVGMHQAENLLHFEGLHDQLDQLLKKINELGVPRA